MTNPLATLERLGRALGASPDSWDIEITVEGKGLARPYMLTDKGKRYPLGKRWYTPMNLQLFLDNAHRQATKGMCGIALNFGKGSSFFCGKARGHVGDCRHRY
jgi:hypothetical protein